MKFARDILFIDFETTGNNPDKDFPLQLSAVLLDKDNLLEKNYFNSYIRHTFSQSSNDRIVQTLGIQKEIWMKSPGQKEVLEKFNKTFSYNVTIATHNITNILFLQDLHKRCKISYEYDYHIIELWTLGYLYLSKMNIKKIPTAETMGFYLKLQRQRENDSLANVRFLAEIFRKLVKTI